MYLLILEQKSVKDCFDKLTEEYWEVAKEYFIGESEEDFLAEGFDVMQSALSLMVAKTGYDLDKIEEASKKHVLKLMNRDYKIGGGISIEIKIAKEEL